MWYSDDNNNNDNNNNDNNWIIFREKWPFQQSRGVFHDYSDIILSVSTLEGFSSISEKLFL